MGAVSHQEPVFVLSGTVITIHDKRGLAVISFSQVEVEHCKYTVGLMSLAAILTNTFRFVQCEVIAVRDGLVDEAENINFERFL